MAQSSPEAQKQAYHWFLLVALCLIGFMTIGTRATLGNFFKTIIADLSWDRGTISFVVAVNLWISGLLQPFAGHSWTGLVPNGCLPSVWRLTVWAWR